MKLDFDALDALERKAKSATKGPWSRCTASNGDCRCRTVWSKPLDDSMFRLAPTEPGGAVRVEDWDYVTALDPAIALALIARIRELDEALVNVLAKVAGST